jgi:hypothetical protein
MYAVCVNCGTQGVGSAQYCWNCGEPYERPDEARELVRETCEILITEGLMASGCPVRCPWFYAKVVSRYKDYVAGQSGGFYCPNGVPEPQYAGDQHTELVNKLINDGWSLVAEHHLDWWHQRFSRQTWVCKPGR